MNQTNKTENHLQAETDPQEMVQISREEYEKLKKIDAETAYSRQKPFSIYDKVNIPVAVLDAVILGGVAVIVIAIIIGIIAH